MKKIKLTIIFFIFGLLFLTLPIKFSFAQTAENYKQGLIDQGYPNAENATVIDQDGTISVSIPCTNGNGSITHQYGTGEVPQESYCKMCGCTSCVLKGNKYVCNGNKCPGSPTPTPTSTPTLTPTPTRSVTITPRTSNSPTPTRTVTPTPTRIITSTPTPSPTITVTKTPTPTRTPTPSPSPSPTNSPTPTFTPTPTPFNPAACTCDGITYGSIGSGKPLTVTSFGKVTGADTSKAQIVDQKFFLAEGAETMATIIARSDAVPATIVSNTSSLVRYQSVWNLTLPQLKPGATYRIWSQINCQPKTTAVNTSSTKKAVLAAETKRSFFDVLLSPFTWLFGGRGNNVTTQQATPTPIEVGGSAVGATSAPAGRESLQLQTIQPVEVYQKTCSFIKFRYNFSAN